MATRAPKNVLFLFAHQDDEWFLASRIEREREWGHDVYCAYLTDGGARGTPSRVREEESRRVLAGLGVAPERVRFLGNDCGLADGQLVVRAEEALRGLSHAFSEVRFRRLYVLAYEGGHQDHDACYAIGLAFARERGLLRRTWQSAAYNGRRAPGRFYRVLDPLPTAGRLSRRRLSLGGGLRHSLLGLAYRSQWRSIVGLLPGFFIERAVLRREVLHVADPAAPGSRPYEGKLLYEIMQRFPFPRFREALSSFVDRHLS